MPVFERVDAPDEVAFRTRVTDNFVRHLLSMEDKVPSTLVAAGLFAAAKLAGRSRELRLTHDQAVYLAQQLAGWSKGWDSRWSVLPQRRGDARRAWGILQAAWRTLDELTAQGFEVVGR